MFNLDDVVKELKSFNWDKVLEAILSLEGFNVRQWRFMKAIIVEISIEKYSNSNLVYVDEVHKDFDWPKYKISVEAKNHGTCMYKKNGGLKKSYNILLTNSMGTNNKKTLDKDDISDIILCVYTDGVFIIEKETALKNLVKKGDGFGISISSSDIIQITGRRYVNTRNEKLLRLKDELLNIIRGLI
jgi:hypothetical protein